jgi:DNA-binding MarR family transcriptional regulator
MTSQILRQQGSSAVEVFVNLLRSHARTTRTLSAELLEEHGLTLNDYEALLRLSRVDGGMMRRVDLAEALILTPSGVTRLLDGLERAGLVEKARCDSDARVTYAALTDAGRETVRRASRSHVASIRAHLGERFTEEELATLADLLGRLAEDQPASAADCTVD